LAAASAPAPSIGEAAPGNPWGLWAMLGGSVLVIAIVAWRGLTRQNTEPKTNP
jgi:hypothetical protein